MEAQRLRLVFLAGDRRDAEAARLLSAAGHRVRRFSGTDDPDWQDGRVPDPGPEIAAADAVVCPALGTTEGGEALHRPAPLPPLPVDPGWLTVTPPDTPWLIGRAGPWLEAAARAAGVELVSYGQREDFSLLNAVPTAEGAVAHATALAGRTAWGHRALVVGAGRCGQALVARLHAWGAAVVCAARDPAARARVRLLGATAVELPALAAVAADCHFVFNTVPARVVTRSVLAALPAGAVVVDVASAPGGTDFAAAQALGVVAALLPGIPARRYPAAAGRIVADTILAVMAERRRNPDTGAAQHAAGGARWERPLGGR